MFQGKKNSHTIYHVSPGDMFGTNVSANCSGFTGCSGSGMFWTKYTP